MVLSADEVNDYYQNGGYNPWDLYHSDARIHRVLDQLVNGFLTPDTEEFRDIFNAVTHHGDEYFVLKDFDAYVRAQERANQTYKNQDKWLEMSMINIARSGKFFIRSYHSRIFRSNLAFRSINILRKIKSSSFLAVEFFHMNSFNQRVDQVIYSFFVVLNENHLLCGWFRKAFSVVIKGYLE